MVFDADKGIGGHRYHDECGMGAIQRDALIMKLHKKGLSQSKIAAYLTKLGAPMSQRGVGQAIQRIREGRPGRDARG